MLEVPVGIAVYVLDGFYGGLELALVYFGVF
jgi:hypothetical protein